MFVLSQALLWCLTILLFPVLSGTASAVFALDTEQALFLQGGAMLASLLIPAIMLLSGRWSWHNTGIAAFNRDGCRLAAYFLPVLLIFIPTALKGFDFKSPGYVAGNIFLYLMVGISEEVYFRGVIPQCLARRYSPRAVALLSTLIFGLGHIVSAFTGAGLAETSLTVINAFIFGWLAMEMTMLSGNIIPAAAVHFLFDIETKFAILDGQGMLAAEFARGALMLLAAGWLTYTYNKHIKGGQNAHII